MLGINDLSFSTYWQEFELIKCVSYFPSFIGYVLCILWKNTQNDRQLKTFLMRACSFYIANIIIAEKLVLQGARTLSAMLPRPLFCLLLGASSDYAQPITGKVSEVTCPAIGRAQPELTPSKIQKTGPELSQYIWAFYIRRTVFPHTEQPRARFLSLAWSKLRLCSANHRPGYWSNLPCDWPSAA